jgi:hypothetical protein
MTLPGIFVCSLLLLVPAVLAAYMVGHARGEQQGYTEGYVDAVLAQVTIEKERAATCSPSPTRTRRPRRAGRP